DRHHDAARPQMSSDLAGGARRGTGGNPVVDDHGGSSPQRDARPVSAELADPAFQFPAFAFLYLRESLLAHPGHGHGSLVNDAGPVLTDRTHGPLGVERHADLAELDHY